MTVLTTRLVVVMYMSIGSFDAGVASIGAYWSAALRAAS
jgi:hypothetical protein